MAAEDSGRVISMLRDKGLTIIDLQEIGGIAATPAPPPNGHSTPPAVSMTPSTSAAAPPTAVAQATARPVSLPFGSRLSSRDITVLTRQLAATMNAGLPILSILRVLTREASNPALNRVLEGVSQKIQKGNSLSDALAEYPSLFDATYINLVRVGEMGGSLPECMTRLATLREKSESNRKKMVSAMVYPTFILIFSLAMTYALLAFLMPMFAPMIADAGLDLNRDYPLTALLMHASEFVNSSRFLVVIVVGGGIPIVMWKMAHRIPLIVEGIDTVRANPPFITGLVRKMMAATFSRSFSLLLKAGVPMIQAITLMAAGAGNVVLTRKMNHIAMALEKGGSMSDALKESGMFPDLLIQMVAMGEEAGSVPDLLEKTADYYEEDMDSALAGLTTLLEPLMMVVIGGIVALFVLGVLLPILGISSQKHA